MTDAEYTTIRDLATRVHAARWMLTTGVLGDDPELTHDYLLAVETSLRLLAGDDGLEHVEPGPRVRPVGGRIGSAHGVRLPPVST